MNCNNRLSFIVLVCACHLPIVGCTTLFPPAPTPTSTLIPSPVVTRMEYHVVVTYPDYPNAFHNQIETENPQVSDQMERQRQIEYAQTIPRIRGRYPTDALVIYGPESAGSTIFVNHQEIKLPDDAFVVILHKQEFATDRCMIVNLPCPMLPYYILARGDSVIMVEQQNGKIYSAAYASHDAARHDFEQFRFLFDALQSIKNLPSAPASPLVPASTLTTTRRTK